MTDRCGDGWQPDRNFWLWHLFVPALCVAGLDILFERSTIDLWLADRWFALEGQQWAWRHHWLTYDVIHHYGKQFIIAVGFGLLVLLGLCTRIERLRRYHGDKAEWVLHAWTDTWLAPGFATWTLDGELRRVRCPLLALHGDRDEFGSMRHPERIVALCGGPSEIEKLEGCGHVPHREHADRVIARVREWLDGIRLRGVQVAP